MNRRRAALLALLLGAAAISAAPAPAPPPRKSLIEFGWDEPDTRFLRQHIAEFQASPFDGCVFHVLYPTGEGTPGNFTWAVWGHRKFRPADVDSGRRDLLAIPWGRFHENFLRVNVTPGDVDWFAGFDTVASNLELAAGLARAGGCAGILFDIEMYRAKLWTYAVQAKANPHSWDEYTAQVRKRGAEAMQALERGFPGLTVFFTEAYSRPLRDTEDKNLPLRDVAYGLLAPFIDGMAAAASPHAVIVDGHEMSYSFQKPEQYAAKADTMRHAFRRLSTELDAYGRRLSVGFGVWMDIEHGGRTWHPDSTAGNWFTPEAFGVAVQAALDHADRYVWIYDQKAKWWGPQGRQALPAVYDSVLRSLRR